MNRPSGVVVLIFILGLAGCGGSGSGSPAPTASSSPAAKQASVVVENGAYVDTGAQAALLEYPASGSNPTVTIPISAGAIVGDSSGNLYAAVGSVINEYPPGAATPSRALTGVRVPWSMAMDPSGNLYVADRAAGPQGGVLVFASGSSTPTRTITNGINQPVRVEVDNAGTIYVMNSGPNTITEYAAGSASPIATIPFSGSRNANCIAGSPAMAVDAAKSVLYFDPDGASVVAYASGSAVPSSIVTQGNCGIADLNVGPQDQLYISVVQQNNLGSGGVQIEVFPAGAQSPVETFQAYDDFMSMGQTSVDASGNVYVIDHSDFLHAPTANVDEYSPTGVEVRSLGGLGANAVDRVTGL